MTWPRGVDQIRDLLDQHALESVEPNDDLAEHLLSDAGRHLESSAAILDAGDRTGAYQLAYDALRKTAVALLSVQGLRATARGGHVAVERAVSAQFAGDLPAFASFRRLRRNRNRFEYPGSAIGASVEDVEDARATASSALAQTQALLGTHALDRWT